MTHPRICVYGDSHIGSVKQAHSAGMLPEDVARGLSFWGAAGPAFRGLRMGKDGRIVPDASAQAEVDLVRGDTGPATLGPDDYDGFIFYAARLRLGDVFQELYHHTKTYGPLSDALLDLCVARALDRVRAVRFARAFARAGAPVVLVPTALDSEGVPRSKDKPAPEFAFDPTAPVIQTLRAKIVASLAADNLALCWQLEDSVTPAGFTEARYAVEGAIEARDPVHKTPVFAARQVKAAVDLLVPRLSKRAGVAKTG